MAASHYETLGLGPGCSSDEIKRAFHRIALKNHPDKQQGNVEVFRRALEAHRVLSDPASRAEYDSEMGFRVSARFFDPFEMFFGSRVRFSEFARQRNSATRRPPSRRQAQTPERSEEQVPRRRAATRPQPSPQHHSSTSQPRDSSIPKGRTPPESNKRHFSTRSSWRSTMKNAFSQHRSSPTVIDLTEDIELSDSEMAPPPSKKRGADDSHTRPSKRFRFDMRNMENVPPMTQTFGNFNLDDLNNVMPDLAKPVPPETDRVPPATPNGHARPYAVPAHKLPMRAYVPTSCDFVNIPQPPSANPMGLRSPSRSCEEFMTDFRSYYVDYIDYSRTVSGLFFNGFTALQERGLTEVISSLRTADLVMSTAADIQVLESWLGVMKAHQAALTELRSYFPNS